MPRGYNAGSSNCRVDKPDSIFVMTDVSTPDQIVIAGTFGNGAVLSVQLDAGKRNDFGVHIIASDRSGQRIDLSA